MTRMKTGGRQKLNIEYRCYGCGSTETQIQRDGVHKWYLNHDEDNNMFCHSCYNKYENHPESSPRQLAFKEKRLYLKECPRTGICSWCGAIKGIDCRRTNIHHIRYHPEDPLKNTIELCVSCHRKETIRLKKEELEL